MGLGCHSLRRTHSLGGYPRCGKNHHGPVLCPGTGSGIRPHPVHAGCAALGCHRLLRAGPPGRHGVPPRRHPVQSFPGGRAEPGHIPNPVRPSGGHGGGTGHRGRHQPSPAQALCGHCHPESHRRGGYSAAAGQPGGSFHPAADPGLPRPQGRGRHDQKPAGRQPFRSDPAHPHTEPPSEFAGHGGRDLLKRQRHRLPGVSLRRYPEKRGPEPGCKPPGQPLHGLHGKGHRPAPGQGLCGPRGCKGGLPAHRRPPGAAVAQGGKPGKPSSRF